MGIYSDTLREKYRRDAILEANADKLLLGTDDVSEVETQPERMDRVAKTVNRILRHFGRPEADVSNCMHVDEVLEAMLDPEGIMYEQIELSDASRRRQAGVMLAFTRDGVPVILRPTITGLRYTEDLSVPGKLYRKGVLEDEAYVIYRPLEKGSFSFLRFMLLVCSYIMPTDLPVIALTTALVTGLGMVTPAISRFVLHDFLESDARAMAILVPLAFAFLLSGLLKCFFSILKTFFLGKMRLRISTQIQTAVMAKVLLMPYAYFQGESVGKQSVQIRCAKELTDLMLNFLMSNLLNFVFALAYIPQMHLLSRKLVVPSLAVLVVEMGASVLMCLAMAKHSRNTMRCREEADATVFELLKGIQKVSNSGAQNRAFSMTAAGYRKVLDITYRPAWWVRYNAQILGGISSFGTLLVLVIAAGKGVPRADYMSFTVAFALISSTVESLVAMSRAVITVGPLLTQLDRLFAYESPVQEGRRYVRSLRGNIDVEDLYFAYDGAEACVDHIDLHIRRGEKIAIVGESGCGKSTLLKLLMGMLTPISGTILYDGQPLSSFNKRSFRKRIGSVFQFTRVFPGTILENILFCAPGGTESDAWEAAELAGIADDIRALAQGMDTEIGEDSGGGFSGGQRQRILIARAFAQKPGLMVLDEATSALDNLSQHKVLSGVYKQPGTVIMVAHRLSTVKDCDRIIVFKKGRIAEEGSYDDLMAREGEFYELVKKQQ